MSERRITREAAVQLYEFAIRALRADGELEPSRVTRQLASLKRILTRSANVGGPSDLLELSRHPDVCAQIFRHPGPVKRGTVSHWLQSLHDFLKVMLPEEEAERRLAAIESRLIPRRTLDWDEAETVGGGLPNSPQRPARLLFAQDLLAATEAAKRGKRGEAAQRDLALVATLCWTPLRLSEVAALSWEDLRWESTDSSGPFGAWARCRRRGIELWLPLHRRASEPLGVLFALTRRVMDREPQGAVFRSLRHPYLPLSLRDVRARLEEAVAQAGLSADRYDLLAAYAYYLMTVHGYTIPDLRDALGYCEPKNVRALLQTHLAWELNRKVDERGGPIPDLEE